MKWILRIQSPNFKVSVDGESLPAASRLDFGQSCPGCDQLQTLSSGDLHTNNPNNIPRYLLRYLFTLTCATGKSPMQAAEFQRFGAHLQLALTQSCSALMVKAILPLALQS